VRGWWETITYTAYNIIFCVESNAIFTRIGVKRRTRVSPVPSISVFAEFSFQIFNTQFPWICTTVSETRIRHGLPGKFNFLRVRGGTNCVSSASSATRRKQPFYAKIEFGVAGQTYSRYTLPNICNYWEYMSTFLLYIYVYYCKCVY